MAPVEDIHEHMFMNLGRWLMENTSDKEVRAPSWPHGWLVPGLTAAAAPTG